MSDVILGKKPVESKKVTEEDASDNALYRFSYSQYVKDELNKSMANESKIQGMPSDLFSQSTISMSKITDLGIKALRPVLRVLLFVIFLSLLYSWNLKLFSFGDFQVINYSEEKCTELNRFDFSSEAWQEEIITSNMNNLKAKYQSDKQQGEVKNKLERLQSILSSKMTSSSQDVSTPSNAGN